MIDLPTFFVKTAKHLTEEAGHTASKPQTSDGGGRAHGVKTQTSDGGGRAHGETLAGLSTKCEKYKIGIYTTRRSVYDFVEDTSSLCEKEKNRSERKGQVVIKYNNGAVASSIMRREPVRS